MYKKILVPLDGTKLSEAILPHVINLAKSLNSELILLNVPVNPGAEFAFGDPGVAAAYIQEQEAQFTNYINDTVNSIKKENIECTGLIKEGGIAAAIIDTAIETGADLIAMATHARSGISHLFLGSIAEKIVRSSTIPVLLVRPTDN